MDTDAAWDTESPTRLPAALAGLVLDQLARDERVVWCGQPRLATLISRNVGFLIAAELVGLISLGPALVIALTLLIPLVSPSSRMHDVVRRLPLFLAPVPVMVVMAWAVLRIQTRARHTAYVITDRRAMIVSTRPTRKIAVYAPADLVGAEVRQRRRGGVGDIILARGRAAKAHGATWNIMCGVEDSDRVMRLIRELASAPGDGGPGAG
jgi:hypothetical protein